MEIKGKMHKPVSAKLTSFHLSKHKAWIYSFKFLVHSDQPSTTCKLTNAKHQHCRNPGSFCVVIDMGNPHEIWVNMLVMRLHPYNVCERKNSHEPTPSKSTFCLVTSQSKLGRIR